MIAEQLSVTAVTRQQLQHFQNQAARQQLEINGVNWTYYTAGQGRETLLILPGLIGFAEMSFQHILAFAEAYRVIAPDYPFQVQGMAGLGQGLIAILDAEQVAQTHVLGGSYGGMVAQWLLHRYPQRLNRVILSHTGGPRPERAIANRRFLAVLRLLPMPLLRLMLRLATKKSLADAPEQIEFWQAYSDEIVARLSKADLISRYQVAIAFDAQADFRPVDLVGWHGRILILEGDNDPIAEAAARESLRQLHPQAEVHTFQGTGHVTSLARVDEYVAVIRRFLETNQAG